MLYIRKINILCYISHEHNAKCLINNGSLLQQLVTRVTYDKQTEWNISSQPSFGDSSMSKTPQLPCCADLPEISRLGKFLFPLYGSQENRCLSAVKWATFCCIPHFLATSVHLDNISPYFHALEYPYNVRPLLLTIALGCCSWQVLCLLAFVTNFAEWKSKWLKSCRIIFWDVKTNVGFSIELLCFYNSWIPYSCRDCWLTIFLIHILLASGWWVEVVGEGLFFSDLISINIFWNWSFDWQILNTFSFAKHNWFYDC